MDFGKLRSKTRAAAIAALAAALWMGAGEAQAQWLRSPVRDRDHIVQRRVWSWQELKEQNLVMQARDFSCGAAALATLLTYYWGDPTTEQQVLVQMDDLLDNEETRDRILNGLTMTDLRRVSVKMGYEASVGELRFEELAEGKAPVIVVITIEGLDHFVVYRGHDGGYVYLADPIRGNVRTPIGEFVYQWKNNAVLVVAHPDREPPEVSPLTVRADEILTGYLNYQMVRRRMTAPFAPRIIPNRF
jgi:predicted double-glycine peptidase